MPHPLAPSSECTAEKAMHVLPMFSMDKLVMQEVAYHILTWLSARIHIYYKLFFKCNFRGVILQLSDNFVTLVYMMIFEQDLPYMSQAAIEALVNIVDWYASPNHTFIGMFGGDKPLHEELM